MACSFSGISIILVINVWVCGNYLNELELSLSYLQSFQWELKYLQWQNGHLWILHPLITKSNERKLTNNSYSYMFNYIPLATLALLYGRFCLYIVVENAKEAYRFCCHSYLWFLFLFFVWSIMRFKYLNLYTFACSFSIYSLKERFWNLFYKIIFKT